MAIAAAALAEVGERVAIVDIDAHHGNGTQDIFYDDPRVLFASIHQSPLYPGSGMVGETGQGAGAGSTGAGAGTKPGLFRAYSSRVTKIL